MQKLWTGDKTGLFWAEISPETLYFRGKEEICKKTQKILKKDLQNLNIHAIVIKVLGSLVKRLRRRPLTAETGVRFPYELLTVK